MGPLKLRLAVYRHVVETGRTPSRQELTDMVGDIDTVDRLLRELHDRHMLVLDDRDERRGEMFADAELVGIPFRITLGPKGLANGMAEFTPRETRQSADVAVGEVGRYTIELVHEGRRLGR